jgi:hypothetical protein
LSASPLTFGFGPLMALLATVAIEGLLALAYAAARGQRITLWLVVVVLVNLVTQPALWFVMERQLGSAPYFAILAVAEAGVWLVEAVLLYLLGGGRVAFKEGLFLSLVLNGVSFGVGLVLPV